MKLIGISGRARSGKDTAAQALTHRGWHRYSFADPLKDGVRCMLGLGREHTDGALKEQPMDWLGGVTPRRLMQTLGTEWGRDLVHPDLWLLVADRRIADAGADGAPGLVIPDVRFDNEANFIRERGGCVIHLLRPEVEQVHSHLSESGVRHGIGDPVLVNDGPVTALWEAVLAIADDIREVA